MSDSPPSEALKDPYGRLFIYYIQGRLGPMEMDAPRHFLGNWEEAEDTFLFFSQPADDWLRSWVDQSPGAGLVDRFEMPYEAWQGGRLEPFSVGRFHVRPPWVDAPAPTGAVHTLLLDPGVVFGAGTHPTTRHCLEALEVVASEGAVPETAVDMGTGTGILAVAAAKMGCLRVLAVDLNLLAVRTALSNIRLNHVADRVLPVQGMAADLAAVKADLFIANIHFDAMMPMLEALDVEKARWLILSGLLRSQVRDVMALLQKRAVRVLRQWEEEQTWFTLLALCPSPSRRLS